MKTLKEVLIGLGPLSIVIILLMAIFGGFFEIGFFTVFFGMIFAIIGFALFLIGIRSGLLLIGEMVGTTLMNSRKVWLMLSVFLVIGFSLTFAEPGVLVLSRQVDVVTNDNISRLLLTFVIALGIGVFLVFALLRMLLNISIRLLLMIAYSIIIVLAFFTDPLFLPIAFDASGVTTGPLTVPFILALGVGMNSVREKQQAVDSFGFVALASVGPIIGVMLIGVLLG